MTTGRSSSPPQRGDAGALVSIDVSDNAYAWRLASALFGAALAGIVYLLTAMLFRRRRIAVLAGLFIAFDLMAFAMSRIAMNDMFTAVFIMAAYALFWPIYGGRWLRSAWWVLPMVGVMIGLAAASKWVGWYALYGLWFLVLPALAAGPIRAHRCHRLRRGGGAGSVPRGRSWWLRSRPWPSVWPSRGSSRCA